MSALPRLAGAGIQPTSLPSRLALPCPPAFDRVTHPLVVLALIGGHCCAAFAWPFIDIIGLFCVFAYKVHYVKSCCTAAWQANPLILLWCAATLRLVLVFKKFFDGVGPIFLSTPRTNGPTLPYYDFFSCRTPYIDYNLHKAYFLAGFT